MAEHILLIDSNYEEAEGFVRGLEEATASPWEVELYPNNTTYGLSAGVMTSNIATAMKAARAIQSGTCVINGTGDYRTSYHGFGGYKMSGVGREGALHTLEEFSEVKTTVLRGVMA